MYVGGRTETLEAADGVRSNVGEPADDARPRSSNRSPAAGQDRPPETTSSAAGLSPAALPSPSALTPSPKRRRLDALDSPLETDSQPPTTTVVPLIRVHEEPSSPSTRPPSWEGVPSPTVGADLHTRSDANCQVKDDELPVKGKLSSDEA